MKAVFLDRDGTIVAEQGYITSPDELKLLPGAAAAIRGFREAGWAVFVVTNQACVAKGLITEEELGEIHQRLVMLLGAEGARIDGVYCCPHHPEGTVEGFARDCDCRKPKPGLLEQAAREHGIDLAESVMVGDTLRDLEAGRAAGLRMTVLVLTGKGAQTLAAGAKAGLVADDLPAVLRRLSLHAPPGPG